MHCGIDMTVGRIAHGCAAEFGVGRAQCRELTADFGIDNRVVGQQCADLVALSSQICGQAARDIGESAAFCQWGEFGADIEYANRFHRYTLPVLLVADTGPRANY